MIFDKYCVKSLQYFYLKEMTSLTHGELIKKLRLERNLSQEALSDGITSRNTLSSLEIRKSNSSFQNLFQYCQRTNITLEEYEFLYNGGKVDSKREFATRVSRSFKKNFDPELVADLKFQYIETHDFFFYSLYAQYYLIKKHFKTSSLSTMSDGAEGSEVYLIRLNIERYLESIYTWGRFELTLFANCLFLFSDEYIRFQYREAIVYMRQFVDSSNYSTDLLKFLINGTQLSFDRNCMENFAIFMKELKKVAKIYANTKASLVVKIFETLHKCRKGEQSQKDLTALKQTLQFLGENTWLTYVLEASDRF
ncbi:transcriptional regulator [Lacticaseibacillus paracasei subsp. paracasei Lpp70]|nr:transcriptional regulator [Lacticaseibacillus paracasei subsp. paracasei Lpp70]